MTRCQEIDKQIFINYYKYLFRYDNTTTSRISLITLLLSQHYHLFISGIN